MMAEEICRGTCSPVHWCTAARQCQHCKHVRDILSRACTREASLGWSPPEDKHRQKRVRWEVRAHRCLPVGLNTKRVMPPGSLGMRWASTMVVGSKVSTLEAACSRHACQFWVPPRGGNMPACPRCAQSLLCVGLTVDNVCSGCLPVNLLAWHKCWTSLYMTHILCLPSACPSGCRQDIVSSAACHIRHYVLRVSYAICSHSTG